MEAARGGASGAALVRGCVAYVIFARHAPRAAGCVPRGAQQPAHALPPRRALLAAASLHRLLTMVEAAGDSLGLSTSRSDPQHCLRADFVSLLPVPVLVCRSDIWSACYALRHTPPRGHSAKAVCCPLPAVCVTTVGLLQAGQR